MNKTIPEPILMTPETSGPLPLMVALGHAGRRSGLPMPTLPRLVRAPAVRETMSLAQLVNEALRVCDNDDGGDLIFGHHQEPTSNPLPPRN